MTVNLYLAIILLAFSSYVVILCAENQLLFNFKLLYMNYFFKSFWFGALITPKCWRCAFERNPVMLALFVGVLFLLGGLLVNFEGYLQCAQILLCFWLVGMVIFIITPRRHYKLKHGEKTLYLFIYDACDKWDLNVLDENRSVVLRVFEKNGELWQKSGKNYCLKGYDDSLEESGFILVRLPHAKWMLLGNGYDMEKNSCILGEKIAPYAFFADKLHFIHGTKVISEDVVSYEKCDNVEFNSVVFNSNKPFYAELDSASSSHSLARKKKGYFLLVQTKNRMLSLFKLLCVDGQAKAYKVFVDQFYIATPKERRYYKKDFTNHYVFTFRQILSV